MELKIPPVKGVVHKVANGDTISVISSTYGVPAETILSFNGISDPKYLQIGDEIIVPGGKFIPKKSQSTVNIARNTFSHLPDYGDYLMIPTTGIKTQGYHGRNGIDIANVIGTPIYAAASGIVTNSASSGWNKGYGNWIEITHPNGLVTRYAHNSVILVNKGDYVEKGQLIAKMGTTGLSTGPHLHFEVHGGVNPAAKLK
jgi:murein DD-endopeptidase MepM/ murein hydrolase activator NlpD